MLGSIIFQFLFLTYKIHCADKIKNINSTIPVPLEEHSVVTSNQVFPYVCAVLKKTTYISAGALIDENWVVTAGDALFLLRESTREIRVRLGSINYRKGGIVTPIKYVEMHPFFSDTKPEFDIALIRLPKPVKLSLSLNPIKLQLRPREITATHFIVTAWPQPSEPTSMELQHLESMEVIKRRRLLTVSHLHPTDPERCFEELEGIDINQTDTLMCLDPGNEPCSRDAGAPVVLNGILWGVVSSWKQDGCELDPGPSFVSLVAAPDIGAWIHAVLRGHAWNKLQYRITVPEEPDDEYHDEYVDYDDEAVSTKGLENRVIVK